MSTMCIGSKDLPEIGHSPDTEHSTSDSPLKVADHFPEQPQNPNEDYADFCKRRVTEIYASNPVLANDKENLALQLAEEWKMKQKGESIPNMSNGNVINGMNGHILNGIPL
jgi:hypothetical protein